MSRWCNQDACKWTSDWLWTPSEEKMFCFSTPCHLYAWGQQKCSADCYWRTGPEKEGPPSLCCYQTLTPPCPALLPLICQIRQGLTWATCKCITQWAKWTCWLRHTQSHTNTKLQEINYKQDCTFQLSVFTHYSISVSPSKTTLCDPTWVVT